MPDRYGAENAAIHAKKVACGHIHKPSQIGGFAGADITTYL
jgi:hypothetical protein